MLDEHTRHMALAAWDLGARHQLKDLRLRDHAHALGFRGQLITKSRSFSTTLANLRGARAAYVSQGIDQDPIEGYFTYAGRGYDNPSSEEVAERLHDQIVIFNQELRELRLRGCANRSSTTHLRVSKWSGSDALLQPDGV